MSGRLRAIRFKENPARAKRKPARPRKSVRTRKRTRLTRPKGNPAAARFIIEALVEGATARPARYRFPVWTGHGLSPERSDAKKYNSVARAHADAKAAIKRYANDPSVALMRVVPE